MARKGGKRYLASLPLPLHRALKDEAKQYQENHGGHLNLNRVIIQSLLISLNQRLTTAERAAVDNFIDPGT